MQTNFEKYNPDSEKGGRLCKTRMQSFATELCLVTTVSQSVPQPMLYSLHNHVFHRVVNLAPSLPVNNWAFPECPFYTQLWYYHLLLVNLEHSTIFPVFIAPVPACSKQVAGIKLRCTYIYKNQPSSWGKTLNMWLIYWIYCTLFNWEYVKKEVTNSHIFFFSFTQDSIFFCN